jgi:hypothetical protein
VAAAHDNRYDLGDGPRDRSLRVGDKERDAVTEILRRHHVEGRLDTDEFQDRLERAMAAKTYADLDRLIVDFPREGPERRRGGQPWRWRQQPLPFLGLALIAAILVAGGPAWVAVPLVFFFVVRPLAWHARGSGYAPGVSACGPRRMTRI